ncbi:MAG: hypothetical protein ACI94O_000833, partial [Octadecabacter sp.]
FQILFFCINDLFCGKYLLFNTLPRFYRVLNLGYFEVTPFAKAELFTEICYWPY